MSFETNDVIVIGGGMGGLVCASYLAQNGLKTLLIEKNDKLGGYCQSFEQDQYTFNTCIRGIVGCKEGGIFDRILNDLSLKSKISFLKPEVYDEIQFFGKKIALYQDSNRTVEEIVQNFPKEEVNVRKAFKLITQENFDAMFFKYRHKTFQQFIDEFFVDHELKFLMSALRIDSGESSIKTQALADLMLIRGNMTDGGYFPKGGMQALPDVLEKCFKANGGCIKTEELVEKIVINNNKATGVRLKNGQVLNAKVIVSNADATFTYTKLLQDFNFKDDSLNMILKKKPSTSLFVMYLATSKSLKPFLRNQCAAIWNFSKSIGDGIVCTLPSVVDINLAPQGCDSVTMYYGMPFRDEKYWEKNGERVSGIFLERFYRVFPEIKGCVKFYKYQTPVDLSKTTLNREGASRGWAPAIDQSKDTFPSSQTPLNNVFLVGHWVSSVSGNGGVTFAAETGRKVAKLILTNSGN